jgi:hypothetical protein
MASVSLTEYEQSGCPRSLSACKHPNSDAVRKRSEALPGSAPATYTLAVGDLAAAVRLPQKESSRARQPRERFATVAVGMPTA